MSAVALAAALLLAAIHLFAGRLFLLDVIPRSRWLSLAGGVSVAYVFLHLLPELAAGQQTLTQQGWGAGGFLRHHVWLVALAGLICFYGLEQFVRSRRRAGREGRASAWIVHLGSFALYNALVGYLLLHREAPGLASLLWYAAAMALHFLVNDYALRHTHRHAYRRGRWLLAAAVLAGWLVGTRISVSAAGVAVLLAFLGGGVILNVLKEELPEQRESHFGAFLAGAAGFALLLLAT